MYVAVQADGSDSWRLQVVIDMLRDGAVRPAHLGRAWKYVYFLHPGACSTTSCLDEAKQSINLFPRFLVGHKCPHFALVL